MIFHRLFSYTTLNIQEIYIYLFFFTNANVPIDLDKKVIKVSKRGIVSKLVLTEVCDKLHGQYATYV